LPQTRLISPAPSPTPTKAGSFFSIIITLRVLGSGSSMSFSVMSRTIVEAIRSSLEKPYQNSSNTNQWVLGQIAYGFSDSGAISE
jgi:hypothetical protein